MLDRIVDLYYWTLRAPYRTWIAHALIALALAPIFGAWTIMVFYFLREVEQVAWTWCEGFGQDWPDHFLDLSAPFVALGLGSLVGWGV